MHTLRLARAGLVLAQHGVRFVPKGMAVPLPLRLARLATAPLRLITAPFHWGEPKAKRVGAALTQLGPSYVKLGQFLATRADVIGPELSADLRHLQDKAAPFSMAEARVAVERALGGKLEDHFIDFGPPVAAASIAQVHKAYVMRDGVKTAVAVKILRPDIERRFTRDLDSYYFAARLVERFYQPARRLKPVAIVDNLKHTTDLEMDLRLEAAAISEMSDNIKPGEGLARADGRLAPHIKTHPDARMDRRHADRQPGRVASQGLRRQCARADGVALVPAPRHARRLFSCRHAPGKFIRR